MNHGVTTVSKVWSAIGGSVPSARKKWNSLRAARAGGRRKRPAAAHGVHLRRVDARFREAHGRSADDRFRHHEQVGVDVDDRGLGSTAVNVQVVSQPARTGAEHERTAEILPMR